MLVAQIAALLAIMGVGVVYGTDVFGAVVQRQALARVNDEALTSVMGNVHHYGDKRMPVPGVVGLVAAAAAGVLAAVSGNAAQSVTAGVAVVLLVIWTVLYARVSAPINRVLTAAADNHETPANARDLQAAWDRIIVLRATLQGLALLLLGASLIVG